LSNELNGGLKAANFGYEQLIVLHVPSKIYAKTRQKEEAAEKEALENAANAEKLAADLEKAARDLAQANAEKLANADKLAAENEKLKEELKKLKSKEK